MSKLTGKQELFCLEYLVDLNATQAAIRAGYAKKTAFSTGCENLKKPNIAERITELKLKRAERVEINADYVLKKLAEISEMDVADIMDNELNFRPLSEWPKVWRQTLSGIDVTEMTKDGMTVGILKKIKWPDKLRNLELLGKHIEVQAFRERVLNESPPEAPDATRIPAVDWDLLRKARALDESAHTTH